MENDCNSSYCKLAKEITFGQEILLLQGIGYNSISSLSKIRIKLHSGNEKS